MLLSIQSVNASQNRIALVIGNSAYVSTPLKNPVNDANGMSRKLKGFGFKVETLLNANQKQMKKAINRFGKKLYEKNSVGLFFFAGHGVQINNTNFLLPIDAAINDEADVEFEAINAARVLSKMSLADNGLNLIILDACRNNPFARSFRSSSRGLTPMRPASGSLILYATEPGSIAADGSGENGLFTEKLLSVMGKKGLKVEDIFKQVAVEVSRASNKKQIPWSEGVILGDFYFNGQSNNTMTNDHNNSKLSQKTNKQFSNQENIFWSSVDKDPSVDAYNVYLDSYPDGFYKGLALIKIKLLTKQVNSIPVATIKEPPKKSPVYESTQLKVIVKEANASVENKKIEIEVKISKLLISAKNSEKALRLTSPKKSSALFYYSQILNIQENQPQAIKGIDNIYNIYISWSETAIEQKKYTKAKRYLNKALEVKPDSKIALALLKDTKKQGINNDNKMRGRIVNLKSVSISMPKDGGYKGRQSKGSGKKTQKVLSVLLSNYFEQVKLSINRQSRKESIMTAKKQKSSILIIPKILLWEDRNTFWSGKPDKITVIFETINVQTSKTIEIKKFELSSHWSLNSESNKPENLLIEPLKKYLSSIRSPLKR